MLTRRRSGSLLSTVLAAVLVSAGCSSSSKSTAGSGGAGGAAGAGGQGAFAGATGDGGSSGAGGTADASTGDDGPADVTTSDAASFCHKSITEYCPAPDKVFCTPTWAEAVAPNVYCGTGISVAWQLTCDGYNVREISTGGDVTWDQYYDLSTGALVAITVDHGAHCTAGPSDFVPPACHGASVPIQRQCSDGGGD